MESKKHNVILGALPRANILLDGGCAYGQHSKGFEEKTSCLIGLDIVKSDLLEYRKRFGNRTSCILASLDCLPLKPNSIDACVLQDSLEHTNNPLNVLSQIKSAIKPNGTLVVTVPNWYNRFLNVNPSNVKTHRHFSSSLGWKKLFRKAGFYRCDVSCIAFPILDTHFLSRNFHLFGICVMLKAHKTDRQSYKKKKSCAKKHLGKFY
ncbi:MAG: class I SAM-dependent methyltransferase [Candidatus Bathyarchaeota archaeon]|nr:class I SAM-dependent methyltransferase [Candidatus Bathyarchaeota archaeon]